MKPILFLSLILAALVANAQIEIKIEENAQPKLEIQIHEESAEKSVDPNLEMKVQGPTTEAQAIEDCVGCKLDRSLAPQPVASIQETASHLERMNESEWANACREFISDGQIGQYGEKIRSEIMKQNQYANIKRGDEDLTMLCPNYPMMSDSSKANVFLLILTSMAFEESSCDNTETARGPNGTARGFFQLHSGREASYGPECNNFDSRTPDGSITCALSVINKQMGDGNLFRQESNYWDVLRPKRWVAKRKTYINNPSYAQIRSAISEFAPCTQMMSSSLAVDEKKLLFQVMDKKIFHKNSEVIEFSM